MTITPINQHILIEPVKQDSFMATQRDVYQEIGTVIDIASDADVPFTIGNKVYFDAWLGKKYPKEGTDDFYWLIRASDIVAYE